MNRQEISAVVSIVLRVLSQLAKTTRTPADDVMASILRANEARLVEAVAKLSETEKPITDQQIIDALKEVGIRA